MSFFGIFSQKDKTDKIREFVEKGAIVIDVRTSMEWNSGHIKQSKNIVLQSISNHLEDIKSWGKPIITVCKSGSRSKQAAQFLSQNGIEAINGGPWQNVDQFMS